MTDIITPKIMREMVGRVVWTIRYMPMPANGFPSQYRSFWPDIIHTREEAYGWEAVKVTRQKPTAQQIEEAEAFLPFLYRLNVIERRAVTLRAIPLGWRRVGRALQVSHTTARRYEADAIANLMTEVGAALKKSEAA